MEKRKLFILILLVMLVAPAFAFQFSPFAEMVFEPTGINSSKNYTIINDSDDSIAVEISALTRDLDSSGNEINGDASKYFRINPSKIIVKPQSTMVVNVRYVGPSTNTVELPFSIKAQQIRYSQGKNQESQAMFNILFVYMAPMYVLPSKSIVNISVGDITAGYDEEGNQVMNVSILNRGNVHQKLKEAELTIADDSGNRITLSGSEELGKIDGFNIFARKKVDIEIPWPEELPFPGEGEGKYQAILDYSK